MTTQKRKTTPKMKTNPKIKTDPKMETRQKIKMVFKNEDDLINEEDINDKENVNNYAPVAEMKFSFVFGQSMIPQSLGRAVDMSTIDLLSFLNEMRKLWKKPEGLVQPFNNHNGIVYERNISDFFNQDTARRGESSSAAANCTARGYPVIFIQNLNFIRVLEYIFY